MTQSTLAPMGVVVAAIAEHRLEQDAEERAKAVKTRYPESDAQDCRLVHPASVIRLALR